MPSQSQETADESATADEYAIRWYQPGDADQICSLFESELDRVRSREYFEWKYIDDPYLAHVPITVAERGETLVGVQAYLPCQLRSGDETALALQPADAVVHADHRHNGLYTRMTRLAIDRYTEGEPSLFFNYPNAAALGAQEQLGWESLGELDVHYRIQRPSEYVESAVDGTGGRLLGRVADTFARGAYGVLDRSVEAAADLTVARHETTPSETLATLYESSVPNRIHVHREARFYEWWLDNSFRDDTTYVARSSGRPVAALVTRRPSAEVLQLREAVPLGPDQPVPALSELLAAALTDNTDTSIVKSVGETLPDDLLGQFGFVSDSAPLLDRQTKPLYMAARSLTDDGANDPFADSATDRRNWLPTFVELNKD